MDAEGDVGLYYDASQGFAVLVAKAPGVATVTVVPYSGQTDAERAELFRTINKGKALALGDLAASGLENDITALTALARKLGLANYLKAMPLARQTAAEMVPHVVGAVEQ